MCAQDIRLRFIKWRILNMKKYRTGRAAVLGFLIALVLLFSGCAEAANESGTSGSSYAPPASGELKITFLDVGQADCTLLESGGQTMLIDAGNRGDADLIIQYLDNLGTTRLDYVVFTHPHEDHIGSGSRLVNAFEVGTAYMGAEEFDSGVYRKLIEDLAEQKVNVVHPRPGDQILLGECPVEFLGPVKDYEDVNDDSIVLKVTHGENRFLFTGDAGSEAEKDMISYGYDLKADLLKTGHHGSATSSSYLFLREVNPKYAVIMCETGNDYGHPHEETLSRLRDVGATVYRTDRMGTVTVVSDGKEIVFSVPGIESDREHGTDEGGRGEITSYIGNRNSKKFHLPDCSNLPAEQNRVYFQTRKQAVDEGYAPCGNCNP